MKPDISVVFWRRLLSKAYADLTPEQRAHYREHAWVYNAHERGSKPWWEFHWNQYGKTLDKHPVLGVLRGTFYWYGEADNAYDARYHGLCAWLQEHGNNEQREKYS